jgi:hypothetical protein
MSERVPNLSDSALNDRVPIPDAILEAELSSRRSSGGWQHRKWAHARFFLRLVRGKRAF